jgi:antagonist of KipI
MDRYSHRLANRLAGNADEAATLEVMLLGPHIRFESAVTFAVAGAEFQLTLNDAEIEMNRQIEAAPGSILKFGARRRGARSYVAVTGGIDVPQTLGSRSTHLLTSMGGFAGRALKAGDTLHTGDHPVTKNEKRGSDPLPLPVGGAKLRAVPCDGGLFAHVASQRFVISPRSDRMGYRLEGIGSPERAALPPGIDSPERAALPPRIGSPERAALPRGIGGPERTASPTDVPRGELISSSMPPGAIQIPPTGQPILLMADRATTGGYALAAVVITADLPIAGQLAPGDWIAFDACSLETADAALRQQEAAFGPS